MEKISRTDRVRNEVSYRVKEESNIVHTVTRRKDNWIGHGLCRNYLLRHVIEGKVEGRIEVTGRRGLRRKQLLGDLREERGYWKLKEEALGRTLCRTGFGRGCRPAVRLLDELMQLTTETKRPFKTLIFVQQTTRRHIPEGRNPCAIKHQILRRSLTSCAAMTDVNLRIFCMSVLIFFTTSV